MSEKLTLKYVLNNTNNSLINITDDSTIPTIYALGPGLATISSICIIIGTFFQSFLYIVIFENQVFVLILLIFYKMKIAIKINALSITIEPTIIQ
ncbi:unnamed protein product [Rotaria sp. Silwood1]|nr:unnamed protein product [Rotaria sp. Silwood1]